MCQGSTTGRGGVNKYKKNLNTSSRYFLIGSKNIEMPQNKVEIVEKLERISGMASQLHDIKKNVRAKFLYKHHLD